MVLLSRRGGLVSSCRRASYQTDDPRRTGFLDSRCLIAAETARTQQPSRRFRHAIVIRAVSGPCELAAAVKASGVGSILSGAKCRPRDSRLCNKSAPARCQPLRRCLPARAKSVGARTNGMIGQIKGGMHSTPNFAREPFRQPNTQSIPATAAPAPRRQKHSTKDFKSRRRKALPATAAGNRSRILCAMPFPGIGGEGSMERSLLA